MKNRKKISFILVLALMLSIIPNNMVSSASPKLSEKTKRLTVGRSAKIKITGAKKSVKWSVSNKHIKITKKAKTYATIKAVSKGTAQLVAKTNGKSYKCKFTIKAVQTAKPTNSTMPTNTSVPTSMPPTDTEAPTETPKQTVEPTQKPISEETQTQIPSIEPTNTPIPTLKPPTDMEAPTKTPKQTIEPTQKPTPVEIQTPIPTIEPTQMPVPTVEPTYIPNSGYVWIPATGSKYHSTSTCSGMKNPQYVTISQAISAGYTPCKKCY